jgi:hypothetical protein
VAGASMRLARFSCEFDGAAFGWPVAVGVPFRAWSLCRGGSLLAASPGSAAAFRLCPAFEFVYLFEMSRPQRPLVAHLVSFPLALPKQISIVSSHRENLLFRQNVAAADCISRSFSMLLNCASCQFSLY